MKEERQAATGKGRPAAMKTAQAKATPIADIEVIGEDRRLTHIGEFDRVLGGGVIPGSVILIGGDPGIGKTTLLLQALPRLSSKEEPVLSRYEWGHDDYSLKIENLPQAPACASHANRPPEPGQQGLEFS